MLVMSGGLSAQQDPLFSQYTFNRLLINPAFAGNRNVVSSNVGYRQNFAGLENAAENLHLTVHAPIQSKFMAVGLKVIHDQIGVTSNTYISGIYAYHLGFGEGRLSLGLEAGLVNSRVNFNDLIRRDDFDMAIPDGTESKVIPDFGFGAFYDQEQFYVGLSARHLTQGSLDFTEDFNRPNRAELRRHYIITAGYIFDVAPNIELQPAVLARHVYNAPFLMDFSAIATFSKLITIGGSYRSNQALVGFLGLRIKENFNIGYAYDYIMSDLANYTNGSHEIMLNYNVNLISPAERKIIDPRYYY